MLSSIEFDHDFSLKTREIQDVVTEGMLPPEFCSVDLPAPQGLPQLAFGVGRVASQDALALVAPDSLAGLAFHGACSFAVVMSVRWGNPSPPNPPLDGEGFGSAVLQDFSAHVGLRLSRKARSEERRVGNECVSTSKLGWSP